MANSQKCVDYAVMITRSELLESKLPAPDMSTSPSGLNQAEQPRQSHPETVQAFDVAPVVQAFIDGLPATPERFKPIDYRRLSVSQTIVCNGGFENCLVHVLACLSSNFLCSFMVMHCKAHVLSGSRSIHTRAIDNTCIASYTHTLTAYALTLTCFMQSLRAITALFKSCCSAR